MTLNQPELTIGERYAGLLAGNPPVLVRQYLAHCHEDAVVAFSREAADLAGLGYLPVSQSWGPGRYSGLQVTVSMILCIFLIGFILIAYMRVVQADGTLAVTYVRHQAAPA